MANFMTKVGLKITARKRSNEIFGKVNTDPNKPKPNNNNLCFKYL